MPCNALKIGCYVPNLADIPDQELHKEATLLERPLGYNPKLVPRPPRGQRHSKANLNPKLSWSKYPKIQGACNE